MMESSSANRPPGIRDASPVVREGLTLAELVMLRSSARADRFVARIMERLFMANNRNASQTARSAAQTRALELFSDPSLVAAPGRFFRAPAGPPSSTMIEQHRKRSLPDGGLAVRYSWPSGYRTFDPSYQATLDAHFNNTRAHVYAWLHPDAQVRPAVIALHGWAQGNSWLDRQALGVDLVYRLGFDVHLLVLPFHGHRAPRGVLSSGALFPSTRVRRNAEGFGQAIHDCRTWAAHLRRNSPQRPVGVLGMSLGGYVAALWCSLDDWLAFAVTIVPLVSLADIFWVLGKDNPEKLNAEQMGITIETMRAAFALHCPLSYAPRIDRSRLLILAGLGDRICHPSQSRALWEHWGRPRIHWYPGGHLIRFKGNDMRRELEQFLGENGG